MSIDFDDLKGLEFDNIGSWPALAKGLLLAALVVLVLGIGYYLDTSDQLASLERSEKKEKTLRTEYRTKQEKAANLELYRKQMEDMQESFKSLLQQLPQATEIPGLLDEISYSASASGVDLPVIQSQNEQKREFYIEQPIELVAVGSYHQLGEFVNKISALPRIVTLHDFVISPSDQVRAGTPDDEETLQIEVTAKTYRYEPEDAE